VGRRRDTAQNVGAKLADALYRLQQANPDLVGVSVT
jgi:hypothetical protein